VGGGNRDAAHDRAAAAQAARPPRRCGGLSWPGGAARRQVGGAGPGREGPGRRGQPEGAGSKAKALVVVLGGRGGGGGARLEGGGASLDGGQSWKAAAGVASTK
jgi:hypothetical protein